MRTTSLMLASLSTLAALIKPADACGSYVPEPRVLQLATPFTRGEGARPQTFVLTGEAPTGKLAWKRIAPGTYDYTEVADAPDLAQPMEVTLLGPSGAKLVSTKNRAFIQHSFVNHKPSAALEIEVKRGEFTIALAGRHTRAKWLELSNEKEGTAADLAWAKTMGVAPTSQAVYVHRIDGSELETVSVFTKDGTVTLVRQGKMFISSFHGWAVGAMSEHGERFIIVQNSDRDLRAEALYI